MPTKKVHCNTEVNTIRTKPMWHAMTVLVDTEQMGLNQAQQKMSGHE